VIATCRLCGQIIKGSIITSPQAIQLGVDPAALEFQATMAEFMGHVGREHPEYINTLAGTANTYHIHLVGKLATSTDEAFNAEREHARALAYWTLAGDLELTGPVPAVHSTIPKA
jgi:hypothetical protein